MNNVLLKYLAISVLTIFLNVIAMRVLNIPSWSVESFVFTFIIYYSFQIITFK